MKSFIGAKGLRIKVEKNFGGIVISHKESIHTFKEKGRVYGRGSSNRICIGA